MINLTLLEMVLILIIVNILLHGSAVVYDKRDKGKLM
jgi:competence protein ComGC